MPASDTEDWTGSVTATITTGTIDVQNVVGTFLGTGNVLDLLATSPSAGIAIAKPPGFYALGPYTVEPYTSIIVALSNINNVNPVGVSIRPEVDFGSGLAPWQYLPEITIPGSTGALCYFPALTPNSYVEFDVQTATSGNIFYVVWRATLADIFPLHVIGQGYNNNALIQYGEDLPAGSTVSENMQTAYVGLAHVHASVVGSNDFEFYLTEQTMRTGDVAREIWRGFPTNNGAAGVEYSVEADVYCSGGVITMTAHNAGASTQTFNMSLLPNYAA